MKQLTFVKNGRRARIDAENESDVVVKALIGDGWELKHTDLILTDSELLVFLDSNGPTSGEEIHAHFGVNFGSMTIESAISNLCHFDFVRPMRALVGMRGVYVSKKHVEKHAADLAGKIIGSEPVPMQSYEDVAAVDTSSVVPAVSKAVVEVSKAEGKRQRANIISAAAKDDLLGDSFRASFWDKMDSEAQAYWDSLDSFKRKLIVTEIKKKFKD